jgi:hypothetical protein
LPPWTPHQRRSFGIHAFGCGEGGTAGDTYRIIFEQEDIKTGRRLEYHTPSRLSAAIDRYVTVERRELLGEQSHDGLWLNQYGEKMAANENGDMVQRQSKLTFGKGFGPHRFRHALGTIAPLADPAHPGVAASVLGISGHMVEQHYNGATQADAANKFLGSLSKTRADVRAVACREFGDAMVANGLLQLWIEVRLVGSTD